MEETGARRVGRWRAVRRTRARRIGRKARCPLPRPRMRGAIVRWHLELAGPHAETGGAGACLGSDIAVAEMGQGDGKARVDHRTAEIDRTRAACGDDPAIIVDILLLAHDRRSRDEAREPPRRLFPASTGGADAISALRQLWPTDAEDTPPYS